ncbi:hypothetical protein [Aeromonas salmonicida]|uniref:hypothetical protein n=1 Tax=Aeromonas salmonicida TaxID=645 RepID=UPI00232D291E|nr:hypothetical protein [Aeromonas salmonicida]WCH28246.1 hypothetical protein ONZ66_05370 [Aeromonas salmonicida]
MNYLRIIFFGFFLSASVFFGWDILEQAFGEQREVYVIDGILNHWAVFGGFILSSIIIVYCVVEILKNKSLVTFLRKGILVGCIVIAPLLAIALKEVTLQRTSGYVECEKLRKLSSRFSSKTYAIDNNMCMILEDNYKAP